MTPAEPCPFEAPVSGMSTNKNFKRARMTAYDSNTRLHDAAAESSTQTEWSAQINALLARDFSFIPYRYSASAVLFRGMSSGFGKALDQKLFGGYDDDKPHAQLEQDLGVFFVSHELSDAISCAHIWKPMIDAGIIVFDTALFNDAYDSKQAAMMCIAEPGFVFKYPMFCQPLALNVIRLIVINEATYETLLVNNTDMALIKDRLVIMQETDCGDLENAVQNILHDRHFLQAETVAADCYPRRN